MKSWLWSGMLTATVALLAVGGVAQAQSTDNDRCSNATLKGDYGFTVHGERTLEVGRGTVCTLRRREPLT